MSRKPATRKSTNYGDPLFSVDEDELNEESQIEIQNTKKKQLKKEVLSSESSDTDDSANDEKPKVKIM